MKKTQTANYEITGAVYCEQLYRGTTIHIVATPYESGLGTYTLNCDLPGGTRAASDEMDRLVKKMKDIVK